jgi:hypothetical protein
METTTTIERAFALARSGTCNNVAEVRLALKREGFEQVEAHLAGPAIAKQLRALCEEAQRSSAA